MAFIGQKQLFVENEIVKIETNMIIMDKKLKNGISVVLLAYKEEKNLRILLPLIIKEVNACEEKYEIIVVDGMVAQDRTPEVCKLFGVKYVNQHEPGFGGAFKTGIREAQYNKFLILDSDGSHSPKYIPTIYHVFVKKQCDIVIGSRYVKGGKTNDIITSRVMSYILNIVFQIVLGIHVHDLSTDYRMYRTDQLKKVELKCENYDILEEVLLKIKLCKPNRKLHIREVPITFEKRVYGESKRRLGKFIISYIKTNIKLLILRMIAFYNDVVVRRISVMTH